MGNEGRHNDVNSIKMRSNGDGKESSQFEKLRTNSVGDKRGRDSPHSHINNGQEHNGAGPDTQTEDGSIGNIGNGDSRHQRGNSQTSNDSARQPSFEGRQPSFEEAGDAMDIQQMPSL